MDLLKYVNLLYLYGHACPLCRVRPLTTQQHEAR